MLTKESEAVYQVTLPHNVSDLLVALETGDGPELIFQASILKGQAEECEYLPLRETAQKIEQAASSGDLEAVRSLISELDQHLRQALSINARSREGPKSLIP